MKQFFAIAFLSLCSTAAFALQIDNGAVSNITTTAADIYGTVTSTNGSGTNTVILYYGTTDSSNSAAGWASSNVYAEAITNLGTGSISTNITGLSPATLYYYRWYLLEGTNTDWAASTSNFWTLAGLPTNTAPAAPYRPLMVDSNGSVAAPTNFLAANAIPSTNDTAGLQSQISSNDTDIAGLQSQISSNDTDIASAFSQISSNDTDIASAFSQITSNDTDIASALSQITSNETDIASALSQISSNDTDIAGLQSQISSNDTDIASAFSQIGSNDTDIASALSQISSNDTDIAALQSGVLYTSDTYTSWTNAGGTYTQEAVFATTPLLTNGFAAITYESSGWSCIVESSTDSNTWSTAVATNAAVYLRLSTTNDAPPEVTSLIISNIVVTSWTRPATWGVTSDTEGQILLVDSPAQARQAANKAYTDAAAAAVTPSSWAQYVATTNVRMNGNRLIMTDGWSVAQTGGVGIVSYADVWATTNELTIAHNGIAVITAASEITGLQIDDYSIVESNVTLWVSTNGVVSAPLPQYTANLLAPLWATLGSYTSTYPTVTNDAYKIDFVLPAGDSGFFRVVQQSGTGSVNIGVALTVQGASPWQPQSSTNDAPTLIAPRWVGDELIIYDTTQVVYRAFGSTTNDWVSIWP